MSKPKVILRHCEIYDPARIGKVIGEGIDALGVRPRGRTLVKPNVVMAHKDLHPHAFTRPEFIDGLLRAVKARGDAISDLRVGENCGIKIPTRSAFAAAGYRAVLSKHRVRAEYFDEGAQVPFSLRHPDALRELILIPKAVAKCEFLINTPKFKAHPWTQVTFALKNYIGIQDDAQRMIDHDHMLHYKIADLQEVISPDFIAVDAIIAGEHTMTTPAPYPLHLVIMGANPVAVDAVCTHIVGLDPGSVDHIRIAAERGYGPLALEDIEIAGDVSLEAAQSRAADFRLTLKPVEEIFNDRGNITTYVGPPPDTYDYCWGGCPGALFEAVEMLKLTQPGVYHQVRPLHIVFGAYREEIKARPGEPVLFLGDCASWQGELHGKPVKVQSVYTPRGERDPCRASLRGMYSTLFHTFWHLLRHRGEPALRVLGCPVSIAENVLYISWLGKVANPYLHPRQTFPFTYHWAVAHGVRTRNRLRRRLRNAQGG